MKVLIDNHEMEVLITKKKNNKNTYLRVKEDLNIYITTNYYTKEKDIYRLIETNEKFIKKMIDKITKKNDKLNKFYYLGKEYRVIYYNEVDVKLGEDVVFLNKDFDIEKWFKKQAKIIFKEELDKIYNIFPIDIPYPDLYIRNMKTRWGVCNTNLKKITLNLELIKKDYKYIDYVIVHELSHLIHPNHSKDFWELVGSMVVDYKLIRKELNNYEYN